LTRQKFLARLQGEITKRGVIDVLRSGIKHGAHHLDLFYGTPSPGNPKAAERFAANRFSVTRQLRYSRDETQLALDLGLFINGLPIATFELKNSLTKQTVEDAVQQYKRDRDPRELLFQFGRCVVHFAADDAEVRFCTHFKGKASWFLPFNQGWNDGAGNPPNQEGLKTDYLWKRILTPRGLTDILENYAQIVEIENPKTKKKKREQIWPRYHQLDVVRKLLADAGVNGAGKRYLIQHSAGSGKSNSIAWLAHPLIGLAKDETVAFDSVIVVTDRRILDKQIQDTIKQFAQVGATVGHAEHSGDLRKFIESGKKIIISTVQKFPFILDDIGIQHRDRRFAIIIDEAHSSQGGRTSAAMSMALSELGAEEQDETAEDKINRTMKARKLLPNASYFAFTATPKGKTLEIFGEAYSEGGQAKHRTLYLGGADRDQLDPILDACVAIYNEQLDEDGQVDFKGKAKAFLRTYGFLASILPYTNAEWEKLSIFLNFLVPKLPAPKEEDLSKGILEAIDMDSYRVEKKAAVKIQLPDQDAEIAPAPTSGGGGKPEPELDRLSNILKTFNDQFGNIPWADNDRVHRLITEDIPERVAADTAYQNAKKNSDKQNARIEHDKALASVIVGVMKDDTELFKQFSDNPAFRRWLGDTVFSMTYETADRRP
jgi:type I site-specific restriction-modification system R (restriction) subunit